MKAITYIVVSLSFVMTSQVSSRQNADEKSVAGSADTTTAIDSLNMGKSEYSLDSLVTKSDSISTASRDTTVVDSIRSRFIRGMGQIKSDIDTSDMFHRTQFLWSEAKYIGDIIWKTPGFFWRDLGEAGKWGQLNAFGMDGRGISILLDGRPMNDPVSGTYNLYDLPLEFIDHTEIFTGSSSMTASSGAAGATLNFVTRSYNSYRPMTKIRFVQDPKGTVLTDGLFTQNVATGLNLMIGFQRHVTQGRFANAALDAWNVRLRLRYNISDRLNIALTDFYTKARNELNEGVDESRSIRIFDEAEAVILNENAWDKRSRHDVTLNAVAQIFPDSSSTTQVRCYYSTLEREYRNQFGSYRGQLQDIDDYVNVSFQGLNFQQQIQVNTVRLAFGGQWEERIIDVTKKFPSHFESEQSFFVQAEMPFMDVVVPSASLRSTTLRGESTLAVGAGVKSRLADGLTVFADASWFDRFPTLQERYWMDSTFVRRGDILKEQHSFYQGGINITAGSNLQMNLLGFHRIIQRPIVYVPAELTSGTSAISIFNEYRVKLYGLNGSVLFRWRQFEVLGVMTLMRSEYADTLRILIPDVVLAGEVSYRDKFFREKLDAKVGARSRFYNRQQSMQFDPRTLSYFRYSANILGRSTTLDLFVILKIGDAHVSLSWENILNAQYMLAPVYPMPGRRMRLGVNWVFID